MTKSLYLHTDTYKHGIIMSWPINSNTCSVLNVFNTFIQITYTGVLFKCSRHNMHSHYTCSCVYCVCVLTELIRHSQCIRQHSQTITMENPPAVRATNENHHHRSETLWRQLQLSQNWWWYEQLVPGGDRSSPRVHSIATAVCTCDGLGVKQDHGQQYWR